MLLTLAKIHICATPQIRTLALSSDCLKAPARKEDKSQGDSIINPYLNSNELYHRIQPQSDRIGISKL
jgi:hypothetical protein